MTSTESCRARTELITRFFPTGIPRLWCPMLTHFTAQGTLDQPRLRRHLETIAPYAKGLLVPGSTGEGWEMNENDILNLLGVLLEAAKAAGIYVLIGVLKTDIPGMLATLDQILDFLLHRAGTTDVSEALRFSNVVGFTICPPKTFPETPVSLPAKQLEKTPFIPSVPPESQIHSALTRVLERGLPTALYQLPQVTGYLMSPETIQALAAEFPNFYLFKDTSGGDRVALSGLDFAGLFLVRGAEGGYARWPLSSGGPYHGFLLSTANVFARELDTVLNLLDHHRAADAQALAQRLTSVIDHCFELVREFHAGNPFTNANKLLDHIMAHGPDALHAKMPLLYSGVSLPMPMIEQGQQILRDSQLLPRHGYLEPAKTDSS